ncbi:MAG: hypothetical protein K0S65_3600 [Labilithrix sp.]|nr:hypothetical protein [Labilithrix sp.]
MARDRFPGYGRHVTKLAFSLAMLALGVLGACSSSSTSTPSPAPASSATAEEEGSNEPPPADVQAYTQAEVQELFDQRCLECHGPSNALLDLSAPFTRETVGVATNSGQKKGFCESSERTTRIVPGDREASLLWHKVKGTQDCGSPMPYDKGNKKLDATELERLGLWIDGLPPVD